VLKYWIKRLNNYNLSPTKEIVVKYANAIRKRDNPNAKDLSVKWAPRWIKEQRIDGLFEDKQKSIEATRQAAYNKDSVSEWFSKLEATIQDFGLQADDILNFNKTGYSIGVARDQTVLTYNPKRKKTIPNDTNREHVTFTETISAAGWVIPPVVILKGVYLLACHFKDLPDGYLATTSESGYTNDEISLKTIKHIDKFTINRKKGKWRLLLLDNHEYHLSLKFLEYYELADIIPFTLPPHITHFLQLLDVGYFQPNKHYYRKAVNYATRMGNRDYNKLDFFADIATIRAQTFKETTIRSAFKKCGI
jgi:hypothetical protein